LGEPEGTEGPYQSAAAGPLPEGAKTHAADPASRVGVQAFPSEPASAHPVRNALDLAVEMDEPEMLITELRILAGRRIGNPRRSGAIWRRVAEWAHDLELDLQAANAPAERPK